MIEPIAISIVSLIVGIILGRTSVKVPPVVPNLDTPRLDYLETTKRSMFYNDTATAWAVLDTAGKPIKAARDLRSAIDYARERSNG